MSAHTPGPWFWADNVPDAPPQYRMIVDADGATVCDPSPMSEHDARLIAAAPELLEALRAILHDTTHDLVGLPRDEALELIFSVADTAHAAIKRATGGAP